MFLSQATQLPPPRFQSAAGPAIQETDSISVLKADRLVRTSYNLASGAAPALPDQLRSGDGPAHVPHNRPLSVAMPTALAVILALMIGLTASAVRAAASDDTSSLTASIGQLERRYFEHPYDADSIDDRLARLEKLVFGEVRPGNDQQRISRLLTAAQPAELPGNDGEKISEVQPLGNVGPATASANQGISDDGDPADSSDYPRVTVLENQLLGRSFVGEPVARRVDQLETKLFGKPSTSDDLGTRVDRLEQYAVAALHKKPFGINPEMETAESQGDSMSWPAYRQSSAYAPQSPAYLAQSPAYAPPPADTAPPPPTAPTQIRVAWLETQVFGHTFANDHLLDRLQRLEETLFPNEPVDSRFGLLDQVDTLIGAVQFRQQERNQEATAGLPPPSTYIASNFPASSAPAGLATTGPNSATSSPDSQKHHPLFRSLAHVLGAAGQFALGSAASSFMGGGGMAAGPLSWF